MCGPECLPCGGVRRGIGSSGTKSYEWLWAAKQVLGTKLRTFSRAVSALNCWDVSFQVHVWNLTFWAHPYSGKHSTGLPVKSLSHTSCVNLDYGIKCLSGTSTAILCLCNPHSKQQTSYTFPFLPAFFWEQIMWEVGLSESCSYKTQALPKKQSELAHKILCLRSFASSQSCQFSNDAMYFHWPTERMMSQTLATHFLEVARGQVEPSCEFPKYGFIQMDTGTVLCCGF